MNAPLPTTTAARRATVQRDTKETKIRVAVDLDGTGTAKLATGIGFFDHMLEQIARHGLIDLEIEAQGDLHIDGHHTVEDVGITLGQAVGQAVGDKRGLVRYGHAYVPLDEALSRVVIDFSGRPGLTMNVPFKSGMIGGFDAQLAHEFFQGFANHALVTLHIDNLRGENAHHQCETVFKAFARALRMAVTVDPRVGDMRALDQGQPLAPPAAAPGIRDENRRRRRLRNGQPALGVAGGGARRPRGRGLPASSSPATRRRCSPPSGWSSPARARCPTACASCANPASRRPCSTPPPTSR